MRIFVDASAFIALFSEGDQHHDRVLEILKIAVPGSLSYVTTNYAVVECVNHLQRRLGLPTAGRFLEYLKPEVTVIWMDERRHEVARREWQRIARRDLSFVDCASFTVMREEGITTALTFDSDFKEAGFHVLDVPPTSEVREPRARYTTRRRKSS